MMDIFKLALDDFLCEHDAGIILISILTIFLALPGIAYMIFRATAHHARGLDLLIAYVTANGYGFAAMLCVGGIAAIWFLFAGLAEAAR